MINLEDVKPSPGWMLYKRLKRTNTYSEIIWTEDTDIFKNTRCEVIAAGGEKKLKNGTVMPPPVKPGDIVHISGLDDLAVNAIDDYTHPGVYFINYDQVWGIFVEE